MKLNFGFGEEWKELKKFNKLNDEQRSIVFYAENKASMNHFRLLISELTKERNFQICYVTSIKNDPILSINDKNTIFFHLNNELESSIFDNIKLELINYINSKFIEKIEIDKKVNLVEKQKTIYTNQDKYEYLIKKNKNLIELKNKLGLDYEF